MSKVSKVKYTSTIQSNVSNVTHVKDVEDGACGFYTNVYRVLHTCPSPLQEGRLLMAFHLVGLAVHQQAVQGGSFVNFLGLVTLQG